MSPSGRAIPLAGLLPEQIAELLAPIPRFRGGQIFHWIHRGAAGFDEMTDLPADLREHLSRMATILSSRVELREAAEDGSTKIRIRLSDGAAVEAIVLVDGNARRTACLSTQVGCAMRCAFCRTGLMGLRRDLADHEIVEQFLHAQRETGSIGNLVFMGMGEPFLNWDNTAHAISVLSHRSGTRMSLRKITVSSCGIPDGIRRLAREGPEVKLAVSLVSAIQPKRETLMPVAKGHPLAELKDALLDYQRERKRRITLEIVLLAGWTDGREDVEALLGFIPPLSVMVNLIPWNPVAELDFRESPSTQVSRFKARLERAGVPVTERLRKGRGVTGACGQLAVLGE